MQTSSWSRCPRITSKGSVSADTSNTIRALGKFQAGRATKIVSVTHQTTGLPLDQGKLGSCTANALCGALDSAPDFGGGTPRNETDAIQLYELETRLEGKPYPQTGMVEVTAAATVRGGHEIVADGIDADKKLVWFWNSWGTQYALGGRFCMAFDTWDRLLQEQGDVTVPVS